MNRSRTLRSRILAWFVGAILLAILAGALVLHSTRPDSITGVNAMARNMGTHMGDIWDDDAARQAYIAEVRDVTGFDVNLVRDARRLPPRVHNQAKRGVFIVNDNPQHIFIPVVQGDRVVGAFEMSKFGPRPAPWPWWPVVLALALAGAVLSIMASRVANLLARPLERLAYAADRFGGGDLGFRADIAGARRWVALEVRAVGVAFNRMADRVEAMVRGQRELLGAISHELRSPLGRARVALEIARDRLPPEAGERSAALALDDVEKHLGAVDGILGDLLDVTRAGLADLHKETRAFVPWLRECIAEQPAPQQVTLEVDAATTQGGAALAFDGPLLARAVHNLVLNARAHGHPDDRPIEMTVTREGDSVRVTGRDRGPGFPEGLTDRVFEPFVRGDAARSRLATGTGSGLGLAIVRRVVEAHGGRAFARNAPGGGAEVGFDLPAAPGGS